MNPLDAGARAWFDLVQARRLDAGRRRPDGRRWQWEDITEDDRAGYRAIVQPVVDAALADFWGQQPDADGGIELTPEGAGDLLSVARGNR